MRSKNLERVAWRGHRKRQFVVFHGKRHPRKMGKAEVEQFLTYLAKERHVAVENIER